MTEEDSGSVAPEVGAGDDHKPERSSKRFRFKSTSDHDTHGESDGRSHKRRRREHESSHRRRKAHKSSRGGGHKDPSDDLTPDQAFRESLFDALGDDEGASFWQGVYGQPIHEYPDTYEDQETGELEQMTDEEYARFVRRKMWEKSWEGIEAAKEEKRQEREKEKQKIRDEENKRDREKSRAPYDDYAFDTHIEASLRRGQKRRDRKRWQGLWQDYLRQWEEMLALAEDRRRTTSQQDTEPIFLRNKIAWPVESGKRKDVEREEVERFVRNGTSTSQSAEAAGDDDDAFATTIKAERVRWHPDKIQQRYGFMDIDESTLTGVTAVFQIFDAIWNEIRDKPA